MTSYNLTAPLGYHQLSRRQVLFAARLFLANLTQITFLTRAFCKFSGIKPIGHDKEGNQIFSHGKNILVVENQQMLSLVKSQSYLLDVTLSKNNLPWIWIGIRRWFGPANKCYNLTLNEYLHAEAALYSFQQSDKKQYLYRLCAVLYRPAGKGSSVSDERRAFDEYSYLKRSRWFRFVSPFKLMAILMFYNGCRSEWVKAFPYLFKSGVISSTPVFPVPDIKKMIRILCDGDVTKNKMLLNTPVWEAFEHLNDRASEINQQKPVNNGKI